MFLKDYSRPNKQRHIEYLLEDETNFKRATTLKSQPTARSVWKNWLNIKTEDGAESSINLEKIIEWKYSSNQAVTVDDDEVNPDRLSVTNDKQTLQEQQATSEPHADKLHSTVNVKQSEPHEKVNDGWLLSNITMIFIEL